MGTNVNPVFSEGIYESTQKPDQEHLYAEFHRNTFKNAMEGWKFRFILLTTTSVVFIGLVTAVYYVTNNLNSEMVSKMPGK